MKRTLKAILICICGVFLNYAPAFSAEAISPTNRGQARASLIPYPQKVQWYKQTFSPANVSLSYDAAEISAPLPGQIESILRDSGMSIAGSATAKKASPIQLKLGDVRGSDNNSAAYQLIVSSKKVTLTAPNSKGLFYGAQTLRQLIQQKDGRAVIPCCKIVDWPAFSHRGFMHDVGRNFQDVDLLKRHLDTMAAYKMNLFHFHLTDRPGFRIESKKYPQLNDPKNYRQTRQPGKFYTYKQINDLIEYAGRLNIQIIPEIDMPGHSEYFNETFGFGMQDPRGVAILKDILKEFFDNVDTPLFHMGSDEVRIKNPAFMTEIADYIRSRGKEVIVWKPGHMPDGKVITQLWSRNSDPLPGVKYLDSRANYVNHMDALVGPIRAFYQQPCRVRKGNELAMGGILCHWPDNNINSQSDIYSQSPVYPAMIAYAERIWRGANYDSDDYWAKLPAQDAATFQEFVEFENDLIVHRDRFFKDRPFPYLRQTQIPWKLIGPFDHQGDPKKQFPIETAIQDEYEIDGKSYTWKDARGGTIHVNHFFGFDGHLPQAKEGTAYGLTYIHSPKAQDVPFWIGFNSYSRSGGRRGGPNPKRDQWSNAHSKIWINDEFVSPPQWKYPGMGRNSIETPLFDEDYFYRTPTKVSLKKGWNKILVKAPKASPAWKWMFTCVPIKYDDGRASETNDLIFSTSPNITGQ